MPALQSATPFSSLPRKLRDWPHSPAHRLEQPGAYIVTAGTYGKTPFFHDPDCLTFLVNSLLDLAEKYGWSLQAWAVFPNHYHFIGQSAQPQTLVAFLRHLHSISAIAINKRDGSPGRKIWFQYWDTQLTHHRAFLARLGYVHSNPVHHNVVRIPSAYPWCSAGWFERKASRSFYRMVMDFPRENVGVPDDF